jgi:hypothetical protein
LPNEDFNGNDMIRFIHRNKRLNKERQTMTEHDARIPVSLPEKEALKLMPMLRNALPGVGVSVYAIIRKDGQRALEVIADEPEGDDRFKKIYRADADLNKVKKHAVSAIKTQFAM